MRKYVHTTQTHNNNMIFQTHKHIIRERAVSYFPSIFLVLWLMLFFWGGGGGGAKRRVVLFEHAH